MTDQFTRHVRFMAALVAVIALCLPLSARAQGIPVDCHADAEGTQSCTVYLPGDVSVIGTQLTLADGTDIPHSFTTDLPSGDADVSPVLYLAIDTSNPARSDIVRQSLDSAWSLVEAAPESTRIGLGTFDDKFAQVIAPTTDRAALRKAIDGIRAKGQNTLLYEATLDIISGLPAGLPGRRDIVLFSDGNAEDTAFSLADVSDRARAQGIRIDGLGAVLRPSEKKYLQTLERLAEETGGLYFAAEPGTARFDPADLARIAQQGAQAGLVSFDRGVSGAGTLTVTTSDGRELRYAVTIAARGTTDADAPITGRIPLLAWVGAGVVLLLVLLLLLRRRRAAPLPEPEAEPVVTAVPGPLPEPVNVYGILTTQTGEELRLISSISTLGRSDDADIVLEDSSVSRRHATISVTANGTMQIVDLNSLNGVLLNGARVTSAEFKAGDTLQLGEVTLTFGYPND